MDPTNRTQESLVGIYRNIVQPLPWLSDLVEVGAELGSQVLFLPSDKLRIHLASMGELDKVAVANYQEAEQVADSINNQIVPSFHKELDVSIAGLSMHIIAGTKNRAITAPVTYDGTLYAERAAALRTLPWTVGAKRAHRPDFKFRLRLGTVFDATLDEDKILDLLYPLLPPSARLQKGKIKTLPDKVMK